MSNQFLTNYTDTTFLKKIQEDLRTCQSFAFSVSFIKKAGLILLYKDLEAALQRGCQGRLITSTYQNFTDIDSLRRFSFLMQKYPAFSCHLDYNSFMDASYSAVGYHSKGYLFAFADHTEVIVGSSNITRYALLKNIEWDVVIDEQTDKEVYPQAIAEFEDKWNRTSELNKELIEKYTRQLSFAVERWDMDYDLSRAEIKPNFMQRKALKELNRYRAMGTSKALIVAAAGSGKTYLAAFDALNFDAKHLLYIVHEESILKKAKETFETVFGGSVSYGIYTGHQKESDADFLFATNLTMCNSLDLFDRDEFDYIIIDECHHAAASTYQKILSYFTPEFLLGLTATPERMDNQDVFALFDENIPFELRLKDAIINDLIVPFHYYGIRDALIDYGLSPKEERRAAAELSTEEHCSFLHDQIEKHRPAGKLKALAFCRTVTHARQMSEAMSVYYHTAYLTGKNDIGERIRAYNDLQNDDSDLEILFTIDILNEGVDIPGVNMVLFLRPTDSSTVFIQQLGRGLRKYEGKKYVTVLDFIGNSYQRSVQIAYALSTLSDQFVVEKKLMSSLVRDDFSALGLQDYGVEIHIDDLSKEEIINYIQQENFNSIRFLTKDYFNFKKYINAESYPTHMDYLNNDCAPDLMRFLSAKCNGRKNNSYYSFLKGIKENNLPIFSEQQVLFLNTLSSYLPLARPHEYKIIQCILHGTVQRDAIEHALSDEIVGYQKLQFDHALNNLTKEKNKPGVVKLINEADGLLSLHAERDPQFDEYLEDLLQYGLTRYQIELGDTQGFKLWHSYRKEQVMMVLCRPDATMLGTYYIDDCIYIFAALKKDASIAEHLNYKDKFLQPDVFQWESKGNLSASDRNNLTHLTKAELFIRKVENEDGVTLPFTYVGTGTMTNMQETGSATGTLLFQIQMDHELPADLQYDFGLDPDAQKKN
ncbi:MAG: DUF3427 domain-containing protein [Solobacterium sp.]|jgi:superfamily II DNA or RNA helicase|nr:DUF3427 domain-containing protein [Solobacterium sp.]MCH4205352.1 DUF3427 domain-containing protein [Solobacterium sp.]MCH4226951.1 DUF3427 domain-containing protein [Solobacterium sp.]MCH4282257.1 DUF3427 domain-containing protein [Solobacterium sp.]